MKKEKLFFDFYPKYFIEKYISRNQNLLIKN